MAADVVGYSRLMGTNEVGTLAALNHRRSEVIEPRIAARGGRVVKLTGDGLLVEFPSVVDAVECALDVQREMRSRNVEIPEDRRIELRIGIHLGDVIVEDGDLFGDGVNVASRIEGVGRPGGVAVSSAVKDNVGNRLDVGFEDMGEHNLKNIAQAVRVFNVGPPQAEAETGSLAKDAPAEDEKPSIAVLPFDNMSGDPEQEFFSDGISEDIITDLSKVSGLFVVGRNTSFAYKGQSPHLPTVASELGVKYLLEGSVRKAGNRVRITGQLIDGATGGHLWADRYDRDLTDIFAIQDEITQTIVDQLKIKLLPTEKKAIAQAPTANVEAYSLYLKGRQLFHHSTKAFLMLARQMFAKAVELDPAYARAYAGIANCDSRLSGWYNAPIAGWEILALTDKALSLDPNLAEAHAARGVALANSGRRAEAAAAFERALELDPGSFDANLSFARFCVTDGNLDRAVALFTRALEIQPDDSQPALLMQTVLRSQGRLEEAERYARLGVKRAEETLRLYPESARPAQGAACALAALGEKEAAIAMMERALAIDPEDNNGRYNAACCYAQLGDADRAIDVLEIWSNGVGGEQKNWFMEDADLDPIRDHPRYPALLAKLELDA
ncbi:MAG TPA: tetratricopeptide repeat protein [Sphingomicrobium sp.]|nr:tetratricopeptide repeat protein [Sphingomicrobium sp.]